MADRDDHMLRHAIHRAQQPKSGAGGPAVVVTLGPNAPSLVRVGMHDQAFGGVTDGIDDIRFRFKGTSYGEKMYVGPQSQTQGKSGFGYM